jgi:hypothetical protein
VWGITGLTERGWRCWLAVAHRDGGRDRSRPLDSREARVLRAGTPLEEADRLTVSVPSPIGWTEGTPVALSALQRKRVALGVASTTRWLGPVEQLGSGHRDCLGEMRTYVWVARGVQLGRYRSARRPSSITAPARLSGGPFGRTGCRVEVVVAPVRHGHLPVWLRQGCGGQSPRGQRGLAGVAAQPAVGLIAGDAVLSDEHAVGVLNDLARGSECSSRLVMSSSE